MNEELRQEALNFWNENFTSAVVSKDVFLKRVSEGIPMQRALTEFFISKQVQEDEEVIEDEVDEEETTEEDYFEQLVGEVEEDGDNLRVFGEQVKAPIGS